MRGRLGYRVRILLRRPRTLPTDRANAVIGNLTPRPIFRICSTLSTLKSRAIRGCARF